MVPATSLSSCNSLQHQTYDASSLVSSCMQPIQSSFPNHLGEENSCQWQPTQKSVGEAGGEGLFFLIETICSSVSSFFQNAKKIVSATSDFLPTFSLIPGAEAQSTAPRQTKELTDISATPGQPLNFFLDPLENYEAFHSSNIVSKGTIASPWLTTKKVFRLSPTALYSANLLFSTTKMILSQNRLVAIPGFGLSITDLTEPSLPTVIGKVAGSSTIDPYTLSVKGDNAFVAKDNVALIVDFQNPAKPSFIGNYSAPSTIYNVSPKGNLLLVRIDNSLLTLDIANPTNPILLGSCTVPSAGRDFGIKGDYALLTTSTGITSVDLRNASDPKVVKDLSLSRTTTTILIQNDFAYVGSKDDLIVHVLNISDPCNPSIATQFSTTYPAYGLTSNEKYLYLSARFIVGGGEIFDISTPSDPKRAYLFNSPTYMIQSLLPVGDLSIYGYNSNYININNLFRWQFQGTPTLADGGNYPMELSVSSGDGTTLTSQFNVRVEVPPVVRSRMITRLTKVGTPATFSIDQNVFYDPNGDALTFTSQDAPSWLELNSISGTFSGTPTFTDRGNKTVTVTADDKISGTATTSFQLLVDSFPTLSSSIGPRAAEIGKTFSLPLPSGTFTDADNDLLTYSATKSDGSPLPSWLSIDSATGRLYGTPSVSDLGTISVLIQAKDSMGGTATDTFPLRVESFPVIKSTLPRQGAGVGKFFSYKIPEIFTDTTGEGLTYSITKSDGSPLDSWLIFDRATNTLSGTPQETSRGPLSLSVKATDPHGATLATPLDITIASPIADQVVKIGKLFTFTIDPKVFGTLETNFTYSLANTGREPIPSWVSFNTTTGTISGTPKSSDAGSLTLAITGNSTASTYTANIAMLIKENIAPTVLSMISNQQATAGNEFSYIVPTGTFGDLDGDSLTYTAVERGLNALPAWLKFDPATRKFSGTPTADDTGFYTNKNFIIDLIASDGIASATTSFTITVGGTSTGELAVKILGPLFSVLGTAFTLYRSRARIWNCFCGKKYKKEDLEIAIGDEARFGKVIDVPQEEVKTVRALQNVKNLASRTLCRCCRTDDYRELTDDKLLPFFLRHDEYGHKIMGVNGNIMRSDVGQKMKVQVIGHDDRILAEHDLSVVDRGTEGQGTAGIPLTQMKSDFMDT